MPTCFSTISPLKPRIICSHLAGDLKRLAKLGEKHPAIHFRSPINEVLPVMAKMNYELPAGNDQGERPVRTPERAVPIWLGLGPRLVTSGSGVRFSSRRGMKARINDLHIGTREIRADVANVTADVEVIADANVDATIIVDDLTDKTIAAQRRVNLTRGANRIALNINVPHPSLWWPNGLRLSSSLHFQGPVTDQWQAR